MDKKNTFYNDQRTSEREKHDNIISEWAKTSQQENERGKRDEWGKSNKEKDE